MQSQPIISFADKITLNIFRWFESITCRKMSVWMMRTFLQRCHPFGSCGHISLISQCRCMVKKRYPNHFTPSGFGFLFCARVIIIASLRDYIQGDNGERLFNRWKMPFRIGVLNQSRRDGMFIEKNNEKRKRRTPKGCHKNYRSREFCNGNRGFEFI